MNPFHCVLIAVSQTGNTQENFERRQDFQMYLLYVAQQPQFPCGLSLDVCGCVLGAEGLALAP